MNTETRDASRFITIICLFWSQVLRKATDTHCSALRRPSVDYGAPDYCTDSFILIPFLSIYQKCPPIPPGTIKSLSRPHMMAANSGSYPISSNSRRKLNAFLYDNKDEADLQVPQSEFKTPSKTAYENKENQASLETDVAESVDLAHDNGEALVQIKEAKVVKECPKTPANRIPLADLIGNTEDAFNHAPKQECTPVDHVIWQHVPASSSSDVSQSSATRDKKRRHSSSPTSSPLTDGLKGIKEPFDPQSIQSILRTPQNDFAAELWNSYVGKSTVDNNGSLLPRFANLLSSSPQTPVAAKTSRDSSGLRRSTSCNADWPISNAKRRRIWREDAGAGRGIFTRTKSNILDSGESNSFKINSLLEKIERSLQKPSGRHVERPSSSSPLPIRSDAIRNRSPSPVEGKKGFRVVRKANKIGKPANDDIGLDQLREVPLQESSSSDYGDDDLDQEFLEMAEASMGSLGRLTGQHNNTEGCSNLHQMEPQRPRDFSPSHPEANNPVSNQNIIKEDDSYDADEFEDGYEGFPENIEEILAKYEQNPNAIQEMDSVIGEQSVSGVLRATNDAPGFGASGMPPTKASESHETHSSDEFGDDEFDIEALEQSMSMVQSGKAGSNQKLRSRRAIKRYLIIDIAQDTYVTQKGRGQPEQVLLVQEEKTELHKVVILRESWFDSPCSKGSYIHLIGDFDSSGQCIVDDSENMVILHPDHLISATVVADSMSCQRRAVLQDRIKVFGEIEKPQFFGVVFHEVFQEAMKTNKWDTNSLRSLVENILLRHLEDLYGIHMSVPEAVDYAMSRIPDLRAWAIAYLRAKPGPNSFIEDRNSSKFCLTISKLLEVEEHIWSPMYGLKGNIDATVQVACHNGESKRSLVVPLELKTGKRDTNLAHRAQTALYTLLLSDRYDVDVSFGLLYYLEASRTLRIRSVRYEILQMIQQRNRLAGYVRERLRLPPMVKKPGLCKRCYAQTPCYIYHKLAEDGDGETSGLGDEFVRALDHLGPQHRNFFRKWDELLTKEEQSMMKFRRELWTLLSSERESLGRCFGNVVIVPGSALEDKDGTKINRYKYTFMKKQASSSFSFAESQITVGEPIVISDENGHFALANGYVVQVSRKRITVAVDRRLHNARTRASGFDPENNQNFKGIMEVVEDGTPLPAATPIEPEEKETVYRLDKDEFSNGMATVRNNLICMMQKDLFQARQLRRLIVEGEPPIFKPAAPAYMMSTFVRESLNVDQKKAIDKVMTARDYALVLGMPGTGKTTTIAHIIRALVARGKSVLLASYTHTAVDNILLKFRNDNIHILRIGAIAKVHPEVQGFVDLAATPKKSIEQLKESYEQSQVVATTCLGINHAIFNQRIFDYCIVDEASQITLPVCLGPIRMARSFILVGDHYQLPPLVQNKEAQEGGLDISLFKLLSDSQPSSVVTLEHQYRMCEDIMLLSNTLIYSGRLRCGTPEVASRSLHLPNPEGLKQHHLDPHRDHDVLNQVLSSSILERHLCLATIQARCWLRDVVSPSAKCRLINTDSLVTPAHDTAHGLRIVNHTEATLCSQLVEAFISCGIPAREIGVITFYRSQLSLLKQNLHHIPDLEMHTADKFQGRDKEVVIVSCVRSNPEKNVGDLLRDWRRVNVAFTRARTKLLVIGSKSTLRDGNELLGKYVRLVEEKGWVYDLPRHALRSHIFEHDGLSSTQSQRQQELTSPRMTKIYQPRKQTSPSVKKKPLGFPSSRLEGSPTALQKTLSPLNSVSDRLPLKKPAKVGAKLLSPTRNGNGTTRILGNRPVLQDVVNDIVG